MVGSAVMESNWDNPQRIGVLFEVIGRLPHDQMPRGMGFSLSHNPTSCLRCKANIALLELSAVIRILENADGEEESLSQLDKQSLSQ